VIRREVARVAERLIEGSAGREQRALQFEDGDGAPLEDDDVRPARIARQLVFEDGGVFVRGGVADFELAALALQPGDGLVPGADLLGGGVGVSVAIL
jgi:hypothetical protein